VVRTPPDFAAIHEQLHTNKYVTLQLGNTGKPIWMATVTQDFVISTSVGEHGGSLLIHKTSALRAATDVRTIDVAAACPPSTRTTRGRPFSPLACRATKRRPRFPSPTQAYPATACYAMERA